MKIESECEREEEREGERERGKRREESEKGYIYNPWRRLKIKNILKNRNNPL